METKVFRAPIQIKADGEQGEFSAVFATLGVVDLDDDVTIPGAFGSQRVLIEPWNHNLQAPPIGKGTITEDGNQALVSARFFLDTEAGREHYAVVKALEDMQEWSYSFRIVEADVGMFEGQQVRFLRRLEVIGVSPVTQGAGIATHTVAIKGAKAAIGAHSTATTDAAWDGPANEARARSGESEAYYRRIYAWRDPDGDPAVKSSYRFVHHMVAAGGEPGAANVRGCQTGIGVLNGGRGGTTIPDGDRRGVWNHLAKHLRDADLEPPELKAIKGAGDGASDDAGDGTEGEAGDGKPSGASPRVVASLVEIELLEG
jgi:hypothetical protein